MHEMYEKEGKKNERQLLTVDLLAHVSMKNAVRYMQFESNSEFAVKKLGLESRLEFISR